MAIGYDDSGAPFWQPDPAFDVNGAQIDSSPTPWLKRSSVDKAAEINSRYGANIPVSVVAAFDKYIDPSNGPDEAGYYSILAPMMQIGQQHGLSNDEIIRGIEGYGKSAGAGFTNGSNYGEIAFSALTSGANAAGKQAPNRALYGDFLSQSAQAMDQRIEQSRASDSNFFDLITGALSEDGIMQLLSVAGLGAGLGSLLGTAGGAAAGSGALIPPAALQGVSQSGLASLASAWGVPVESLLAQQALGAGSSLGGFSGFDAANNFGFSTDLPGFIQPTSGTQGANMFDFGNFDFSGLGDVGSDFASSIGSNPWEQFLAQPSNGDFLSGLFPETQGISELLGSSGLSGDAANFLNYLSGGEAPSLMSAFGFGTEGPLATGGSGGLSVSDLVNYGSKAAKLLGGNAGAVGGLLGGLSGFAQPTSGTSTTTRDIPPWLAPYMGDYLAKAQGLATTPQDPLQAQAYNAAGTQGQQDYQSASGWLQGLLAGNKTNPFIENPYLEQSIQDASRGVTENYRDAIMPSMNAMFSRQGAFGGSAYNEMAAKQSDALNRNLGEIQTTMRNQDFTRRSGLMENQLQRQLAGVGMSPSIANQGWGNLQNQYNFGEQKALWPAKTLENFGNAVRTGSGTGAGSVSEPWNISRFANTLGGALGGSQIGSNLQGFWNNVWGSK